MFGIVKIFFDFQRDATAYCHPLWTCHWCRGVITDIVNRRSLQKQCTEAASFISDLASLHPQNLSDLYQFMKAISQKWGKHVTTPLQRGWRVPLIIWWYLHMEILHYLPTALPGKVSVASVCPSVCFHSIFWADWPLNFGLCVFIMIIARLGSKVKVIGQVQRLRQRRSLARVNVITNAVKRSVWPRSSIVEIFLVNLCFI